MLPPAAQGTPRCATNREAAAELFLSPKTVEFHLAHIYRKLGIRSRSQLSALVAAGKLNKGEEAPVDRPTGV